MKQLMFTLLVVLMANLAFAQSGYSIKPKGYIESGSASTIATNQLSSKNKTGGSFRLKEFSATEQKVIETDLVTFFIAKNNEKTITIHLSCAKPVQLNYVLADKNKKHTIKFNKEEVAYRLVNDWDISSFKNGICTLSVYNEKKELIHIVEFEKTSF